LSFCNAPPLCNENWSGIVEPFGRFLCPDFSRLWRFYSCSWHSRLGPVFVVSPIASTTPIWTLIINALFLREIERINLASAVGTVLAVAGVVAIALAH
jgi:drug/metabolite transporter (DMT)-like permease